MPDNATVFTTTQIGVETTPGTGVAADKKLNSISIEPAIKAQVKSFAPRGSKFDTVSVLGKEWSEAKISGEGSYTDLTYLFASVFAYAAPTQINTPSGLAYKWVFTPAQSAADTVKTFTVESGNSVHAVKFANGLITDIGFTLTREEFTVDGSMLGQAITDAITLTAAPTELALKPIFPNTVDVYLDTTSGGLGVTKLTKNFKADFKMSGRFNPVWPINSANTSFASTVEAKPKTELKLLVEVDTQGMGLLTHLRAADTLFVRIVATGAQIDASPIVANYTFQFDYAGQVMDVAPFSDENGIYAIEWTLNATYDSGWAKALTLEIINELTAL